MHTYTNTNHIITYIHNFLALIHFESRIVARAGLNSILATRFGLPVRTYVQKTSFRATGLYVTFGVSWTPTFLFFCQNTFRFDALAAESIQNGPLSGAAAENNVASEARNAPGPGGPGASKTFLFALFLQNEIHPGSAIGKF